MRLAVIAVALAASAAAQTGSSTGFSFSETVKAATDVVVADIVSGAGVDDGSKVVVRARVIVVRTLSGHYRPGAELGFGWEYKPLLSEGPAVTSKVPLERGLWFLKPDKEGGVAPLRVTVEGSGSGGYYLPAGAAPRYYSPDAPLSYKIACEIAPIIEDIATHHADDLAPRPYVPSVPLTIPEWARTLGRFQALLMALQNLDGAAKSEIYNDFSARPEPYLKAIGIGGRLASGDASALLDLEKNVAVLAPIFANGAMHPGGMGVELRSNLPAARALARLAIAETTLPTLEFNAAMQLAGTRSAEFLPYFVVMLGAPAPSTRDAVLTAFCPLLRDTEWWKPEMANHCPNRTPLNDAAAEQAEIRYWTSWWDVNREKIAKTTVLADVHAPARYSIPQNPTGVSFEVPLEIRFLSLVEMARHEHDPVAGQLSDPDRAGYREVSARVNTKLDANQRRSEQMMDAARVAGKMPEFAQMKALNDQRTAILKAGLDELRNRLSPAGWQAVEKFFAQMGGGMVGGK
jgi:hypothetical protein